MCQHSNEIMGEVLAIEFDENDIAEMVAKPVWICYDCEEITNLHSEENANVQQAC